MINYLKDKSETILIKEKDVNLYQTNKKWSRNYAIDFLKGWMIILVIVDHSFTHSFLSNYYNTFWERISIPVFLIIMGLNMVKSFDRKLNLNDNNNLETITLRKLYSFDYFSKKLRRYVIPYLFLYLIDAGIYFFINLNSIPTIHTFFYDEPEYMFIGYTPFWGPGMWFMPVIFWTILLFPLLYYFFKKHPILTFIGCFLVEISFRIVSYVLYYGVVPYNWHVTKMFFICNLLYVLSAVAIGMWLSVNYKIKSKRNLVIWVIFLTWLLSMALKRFLNLSFEWIEGDYYFLIFSYSGVIVMFIMTIFPKKLPNWFKKAIVLLSNSTYHILLFQIFYFSIIYHFFLNIFYIFDFDPLNYAWYFPVNLIIALSGGIMLYKLSYKWKKFVANNQINLVKIIRKIGLIAAFIFMFLWVFLQIMFFLVYPVPGVDSFLDRLILFILSGFQF